LPPKTRGSVKRLHVWETKTCGRLKSGQNERESNYLTGPKEGVKDFGDEFLQKKRGH